MGNKLRYLITYNYENSFIKNILSFQPVPLDTESIRTDLMVFADLPELKENQYYTPVIKDNQFAIEINDFEKSPTEKIQEELEITKRLLFEEMKKNKGKELEDDLKDEDIEKEVEKKVATLKKTNKKPVLKEEDILADL